MFQNYSPSLINNGLVFCVDAADNKSAPHNQLPVKLGCVTWLDGADDDVFTFSSGTSVYEWRDKSGYNNNVYQSTTCLLYTSPSPRDATLSRMPSSA